MLWYKAWRESRTRFAMSMIAVGAICAFLVLFHSQARTAITDRPIPYAAYIWKAVYKSYLRELFVLLVILLGVGGLMRERAHGTASFTLALPVSRWRIVAVRATVGLLEVVMLSLLPCLLIPLLSPLAQQSYPYSQALQFSLLWVVCGAFFFSVGFLSSIILDGAYTAPVVSLSVLLFYSVFMELPGVERLVPDIHDVMSGAGMPYFRSDTAQLVGTLPWQTMALILLTAFGMVVLACVFTRRQDF
jgi:ABC-type transport system involved in multi-copper enzyme maturation permease subunit